MFWQAAESHFDCLCFRSAVPSKGVGSQPKVHKLGSSPAGSSSRPREPDSMLLQQSWGINNTVDIGTLQNVR